MFRLTSVLLIGLLVATAPADAQSLRGELAAQFELAMAAANGDDEVETLTQLEAFYRGRGRAPLWVSEGGAGERAQRLAALLAAADQDALDPADYHAAAIDALLAATRADLLAELELRLSVGVMRFASDLGEGRVTPHASDPKLFLRRDEVDKRSVIAAASEAPDLEAFVDRYRPQTARYDRLRAALADYRAMAAEGGWQTVPAGATLKPGMVDPRVSQLRSRLILWGDLDTESSSVPPGDDTYDQPMVAAVKRMQIRHGLEPDGIIGSKTLAAFNVPVERRIEQIVLNLERRRWMPDDLGRRHVFVNLSDFVLKVVDGERTVHDARVVVGKPYHMTPVFSHEMTYLVLNPYWNVPPSIASEELLPKIKQDARYLEKRNFTLFSSWSSNAKVIDPLEVDWSRVNDRSFPYKLRQGPGDGNALGRVKFMFPNRFNVYLHDTPSKALFDKAQRSFSHGCIRVQFPDRFAEVVLTETPGWDHERIVETIDSGDRTIVTLSEPLPVHLSYLTAWVNKDGSVHFRDDIYGRDRKLADALLGPRATALAN